MRLAEEFVQNATRASAEFARHRGKSVDEINSVDLRLFLERFYDIHISGISSISGSTPTSDTQPFVPTAPAQRGRPRIHPIAPGQASGSSNPNSPFQIEAHRQRMAKMNQTKRH